MKTRSVNTTRPAANAGSTGYRWTHVLGITTAVTAVGIVGGAFAAAPGEASAMAGSLGGSVSNVLASTLAGTASSARGMGASLTPVLDILGTATPRTLALAASGLLAAALGAAAAVTHWRARTAVSKRHPGIDQLVSRGASGNDSMPLADRVPSLRMLNRDFGRDAGRDKNGRAGADRTPKQVRALAAQGTTPVDIARHTGLSLDAVVLCLAVSGNTRQVPPSAA